MTAETYLPLVKYFASARGLEPSKITTKKLEEEHELDAILYEGHTGMKIIGFHTKQHRLLKPYITLYVPYVEGTTPYIFFSQSVLEDFKFDRVPICYKRNSLPEFNEVVEELRQTRRIPIEQLSSVSELIVHRKYGDNDGFFYGKASYEFGLPRLERLCMVVDPGLKEVVPEAEKQIDQDHDCIHGRDAPFIPFWPPKCDKIEIDLVVKSDEGDVYLKKFLDGLLVQQDLYLSVENDSGVYLYRNPSHSVYEVSIRNPNNKGNIDNLLTLMRRLEDMFKQ